MPNYRRACLLLVVVAALSLFTPVSFLMAGDRVTRGEHSARTALFSPAWYVDHIAYLAGDELEGRGTGQAAIDVAADYIADRFQALGLKPAGDDGSYFQTFTLPLKNEIGRHTRLALRANDRPTWRSLKLRRDHVPYPCSGLGRFKGEIVFAGYGLTSDEESVDYNDYAGVDVEGKVVLVLDGTPRFAPFRWYEAAAETKMWRAVQNGAAAVLIVRVGADEDEPALIDFERRTVPVFRMAAFPGPIPVFNIRQEVADGILTSAGLPGVEALSERIEKTQQPVFVELAGIKAKGCADVRVVEMEVRNVIGVLPGSGPQADEYIVLGAHYDHHGIRNKGMAQFNPDRDIYNGADDNASGVAMLMTLGRAFAQGARPNRSLLFIAFTAEELGLHGSTFFTNSPTVDLDDCAAMLNFDMVGRLHEDRIQVMGMRTGEFEEMIERLGDRYSLDVVDGGGPHGGSDQSPFYDQGIPVLFFHTGLHEQYTRPEDDTERINGKGAMRIARMAADCVDEIDAKAERPPFHRDDSHASMMRTDDADLQGQRIGEYFRKQQKRRAFLGVKRSEDESERGFLVSEVMPGMPAERAGVLAGDRIVQLGNVEITSPVGLVKAVQQHRKGDETTVVVERDGERHSLSVRFGEATGPVSTAAAVAEPSKAEASERASAKRVRLGVRVKDDDGPGLLITQVVRDTPARWAGLHNGDRLVKLGDVAISTRDDLVAALAGFKPGDETQVQVDRGDHVLLALRFGTQDSRQAERAKLLEWVQRLDGLVAMSEPKGGREISIESKGLKMATEGDAKVLVDSYCDYVFEHGMLLQDDVTISVKTLDGGEATTISVSVTLPAALFKVDSDD